MTPKISVCLIVKNEEVMIEDCLNSLIGVDQIVILDTGSTDSTSKCVDRWAELHPSTPVTRADYQWADHFADARNASAEHAVGDWILVVDADETLDPGSLQALRTVAAATQENTLRLTLTNVFDRSQTHPVVRAYRRQSGVEYVGRAHELPNQDSGELAVGCGIHYGHSPAHFADPGRMLRIIGAELVEQGEWEPRTLYYYAREFYYLGRYEESVKWFSERTSMAGSKPELADAWLYRARSLWALHRGDEARACCAQAVMVNPNFREALLFMADMSWPDNAEVWSQFAALATGEGLLFNRG